MAKEITKIIKLQINAGAANPSPPVGPALGQAGVNIMAFCKEFNAATQKQAGDLLPTVITVYKDKSFSFITKQPPGSVLLKKAAGIASGSGEPNKKKVATLSKAKLMEVVNTKLPALNAPPAFLPARLARWALKLKVCNTHRRRIKPVRTHCQIHTCLPNAASDIKKQPSLLPLTRTTASRKPWKP
mgnify:CR=1 FL=1